MGGGIGKGRGGRGEGLKRRMLTTCPRYTDQASDGRLSQIMEDIVHHTSIIRRCIIGRTVLVWRGFRTCRAIGRGQAHRLSTRRL